MGLHRTRAICLALLGAALPTEACRSQDEVSFRRGLRTVRTLMSNGRWHIAKSYLLDLLEKNHGAGYARAKRADIVEYVKRCEFYETHRRPAAGTLISGKLRGFNRASRRIDLRYRPDNLDDFTVEPTTGMYLHPVEFDGPYTITLRGPRYTGSRDGARFFVCIAKDTVLDIACGIAGIAGQTIARRAGRDLTELSPLSASTLTPKRPYRLVVKVNERSVEVFYGGNRIMTAAKSRGGFGRFGFGGVEFSELRIQGSVTPSWLQSVVDEYMLAQLAAFEKTFEPRSSLPGWLFEVARHAEDTGANEKKEQRYPGRVTAAHVEALNRTVELLNAGDFAGALRYLDRRSKSEVPAPARAYLRAICLGNVGELAAALAECDAACSADESFAPAHVLRARILIRTGRRADAVEELEGVLARHPHDIDAYGELPVALLRLGRPAEALGWVERARELGLDVPDLGRVERMLTMALQGPAWDRSYDYQSRHYHVFSDIDRRTCIDAARVLERALEVYSAQLGATPERGKRFRVYVFSGHRGYQAYCEDILGGSYRHTKGLYSADLKQLLIWNLSDREEMFETVRHEGFHQYLDSVMEAPPAWLNEGLATYYEVGDRTGKPRGGVIRRDLIGLLARTQLLPLRDLLALSPSGFYRDASRNYAQSWALVHFLRESSRGRRLLFRDVFRQLQSPRTSAGTDYAGLDDAQLDALDRGYRAYVGDLIRKHGRVPSRPR